MKKYIVASVVFGSAFVLAATPIFAIEGTTATSNLRPSSSPKVENRVLNLQKYQLKTQELEKKFSSKSANAQRLIDNRCRVLQSRVSTMVGRYDQNYPTHVANYKKMTDSARKVITAAKAAGKDTSAAETALNTVETKVATLNEQSTALIAQLKVAQQLACGESKGQYALEIAKARTLAQAAYKTSMEIKSYFLKTVRPAIYALAKEIRTTGSAASQGDKKIQTTESVRQENIR